MGPWVHVIFLSHQENSQALMSDDKMTLEMEPIDQGAANPSYDSPLVSLDYVQDDYDHYRHRRSIDPDTGQLAGA